MEEHPELKKLIEVLVKDISKKKELSNVDPGFARQKIKRILEQDKKMRLSILEKFKKNPDKLDKTKEHDKITKLARAELRRVYGVFIKDDYKKRHSLLLELKEDPSLENHNKILELHQSSKERVDYYDKLYKKIFEITGLPKKIVDLACGLNPVSYPYLGCKPEYFASDLSEKDLEFLQEYFDLQKISGRTKAFDLTKEDVSGITAGSDICFLFKTLDTLEASRRNISKTLLPTIKSRFVVVSFATKSIGGKKDIGKERRAWLEKILSRNEWKYEFFELPNELFYIIAK